MNGLYSLLINFFRERTNSKFDWTPNFRKYPMYHMIDLKRWYVITTMRAAREAKDFINYVITAGKGMRFTISNPRM